MDGAKCDVLSGYRNSPCNWYAYVIQLLLYVFLYLLTVILYNCSALAEVCSSCLSVSNLLSLDCGWCHDSSSCVVTESCSASSTFTANSSDTCPLPQITMVCSMLQYVSYNDNYINGTG